ncbi:hypothetical protein TCSYLVIO_007450 [Trypanosoma cruzi]|nr:hypothetical protein TCSYLVIO_007450 [Trypanosoma cruzi]
MGMVSTVFQEPGRPPFAKELWIIVPRVPRATGPRRCGNSFNMLSGPGAEPSKESRMATTSTYGGKGRSISQSPAGKGVRQQQQYKVTWHVKAAQNGEQADFPVAEAGRIRGQDKCGAQPIPEDEDAAPPRREDIATSGWVRLQVFSRRLPEAQRSNGVGLDFVPPFFGYIRLEAGCLQVRQCVRFVCCFGGGLGLFHFVCPFVLGCHGCRAGYGTQLLVRCLREDPTIWTRRQGMFHKTR